MGSPPRGSGGSRLRIGPLDVDGQPALHIGIAAVLIPPFVGRRLARLCLTGYAFFNRGRLQQEDRSPTHGHEPTREGAMAAFAKSWRRE
jgi:hypothetical protein